MQAECKQKMQAENYTRMHVCTRACTYVCVHGRVCARACVCTRACVGERVCVCAYARVGVRADGRVRGRGRTRVPVRMGEGERGRACVRIRVCVIVSYTRNSYTHAVASLVAISRSGWYVYTPKPLKSILAAKIEGY